MSDEEYRQYRRLLHDAYHSPDVLVSEELQVPVSDLELIQAVFSESEVLSFADESTDVKQLREVLANSRRGARARGSEVARARDDVSGLGARREEARRAYEQQARRRPERRMVDVVIVLRRRSEQDTPTQTETVGTKAAPEESKPDEGDVGERKSPEVR